MNSQPHDAPEAAPLISIVVPALDEVANVPGLLQRYREFAVTSPNYRFELFVIDDGSTDGTADALLALSSPVDRVTVVQLSRSFGSHYAITAGLARCSGDCAVVFGADLQEPPEVLAAFLQNWENGSDVVWGIRRLRKGSAAKNFTSKVFSWMFGKFANLANYPAEGPSNMLVDRCVIDEVVRMPERNRNLYALVAWLGFSQTRVAFDQADRAHGTTRWTTRKMIKLAVDSLLQFSAFPLRFASACGLVIAALGLLYAVVLVIRALFGVETPSGWPTVLVVVLVVGGAELAIIGIMGEYLWRGLDESRRRPLYVIRDVRTSFPSEVGASEQPRRGRRLNDQEPESPQETGSQ